MPRTTHERLQSHLAARSRSPSPRALRKLLGDLQAAAAPQVGEVEGARHAQTVAEWYAQARPEERQDLWWLLCEQFAADAAKVQAAGQGYEVAGHRKRGPSRNCLASGFGLAAHTLAATFCGFPRWDAFFGRFARRIAAATENRQTFAGVGCRFRTTFLYLV